MARISGTFFCASATALLFFTLAPPRRAPPFLVRASGAVALKVAQVPSTGYMFCRVLSFYLKAVLWIRIQIGSIL